MATRRGGRVGLAETRSRSVGEVALHSQLEAAHQKIFGLEEFIRDRERQYYQAAQPSGINNISSTSSRYSRHVDEGITPPPSYAMQRRRRTGRAQDALMALRYSGSMSIDDGSYRNDSVLESLKAPLGDFVCLKLVKVHTPDDDVALPFILRRLIGREYHIGAGGVMIGSSFNCDVRVPAEADVFPQHCSIKTGDQRDAGFIIDDLTTGSGILSITDNHNGDAMDVSSTASTDDVLKCPVVVTHGVRFITGRVVWDLVALPDDLMFRAKVFNCAEKMDLLQMKKLLETNTEAAIPTLAVTNTEGFTSSSSIDSSTKSSNSGLFDVNCEYRAPVYEEDDRLNNILYPRRGSERISVVTAPPSVSVGVVEKPSLLLHIAINNGDIEMVKYLLGKGADVDKCTGSLQYSAVHLAASTNNAEIMAELMQYGADLECRNAENLTPLALTTSYEIRKMILNSILLCSAADAGDISEVTRLLALDGVSPNVKGLRHKSSIHLAAFRGYPEILELLILNGGNVNQKGGSRQRTPLHYAALGGHAHCIQLLLSAGAHEFIRDIAGYTPLNLCKGDACGLLNKQPLSLCLAVQSGNVTSVTKILEDMQMDSTGGIEEQSSLVNLRNENGHAPLHLASITGSLPIAQVLVSFDATVDIIGGKENWTPLFYAAMAGHVDLVEFFLSVGSNLDIRDRHGNTLKELVMKEIDETKERMNRLKQRERSESVVETKFLARLSVNMLRQESSSSCSVENELQWQSIKLKKLFQVLPMLTSLSERLTNALDAGNLSDFMSALDSNSSQQSTDAFTDLLPIFLQACEDGLTTFVKALLDYGLNPCVQGSSSEVPLLVAAKNGEVPVLKLLIAHGVDPNVQSSDTLSSALHEAASMNELLTVKYLLSVESNKDLINASGEKPFDCSSMLEIQELLASGPNLLLVAACANDCVTITELVAEQGVNVDHQFHQTGHSALHQACKDGFIETVRILLELGANINLQGGNGFATPLHIASGCDHLEIARMLLTHGARVDLKNAEGKVAFEVAVSNKMRKVLVESRVIKPSQPIHTVLSSIDETRKVCVICMDKPINTIILPCGHQSFCVDCATQLNECALDRKPIKEIVPVFN